MSTESKKCEKQWGTITNHNQGSRWPRENSIKHIIVKIMQFQPKFLHKRHNNRKGLSLAIFEHWCHVLEHVNVT